MTVVYNLRYISEDTNPWDSNESMGIFASLDAAKAGFTASMFGDDHTGHVWVPLRGGFPRVGQPSAPAWSLVHLDDIGDDGTASGDYGFHILEEEVLGGEIRPTDTPVAERQWNVQDGPFGPVEALTTFPYMLYWLQRNTDPYGSLVMQWCREHPIYVHDHDPRGRSPWASGAPIRLEGGGFVTVSGAQHRSDSGLRTTMQILRLPHRALSANEARGIATELQRLVALSDTYDTSKSVPLTQDAPAPASGGQARMRIISEVLKERARQDRKWGQQDLPDGTGPDETGPGLIWSYSDMRELAQEACDDARDADDRRMDLVLLEEVFEALAEQQPGPLRIELLQVAAIAVKWIEMIDRRPE